MECTSVYLKDYYAKNKDKMNADASERRMLPENKERERDRLVAWRAANPDAWKEHQRRSDEKYRNSEKGAANRARRRARVASTKQPTPVSLSAVLKAHGMHCHICNKQIASKAELAFDHVVPLARGGLHTEENLRPAHMRCNAWKCDRTMAELAGQRPPPVGATDAWQLRRREKANRAKSEKMRAWWANPANVAKIAKRNDRVAENMRGNNNGAATRGTPRRPASEEAMARRADGVRSAYAKWTPERRAEHARKVSEGRQRGLAQKKGTN